MPSDPRQPVSTPRQTISTLGEAARAFLRHEGARAPDFSACLILLPHHHAGVAFRRALRRELPQPFLLPPQLRTLPEWAATASLADGAEADSLRLAQLRDFLAASGRLPRHALWQAAGELLQLVDELDAEAAALDESWPPRRSANRYLSLEAALADAVWRAFAGSGGKGRARLYARRLSQLAERAAGPLYTLGLADLNGVERDFLRAWATRAPVIELPATPGDEARAALLRAVWDDDPGQPLATRAAAMARSQPSSPLAGTVELLAAPGLEAAAEAAQAVLLRWLAEGRRDIALIASDRLMARRLRALLERRGILARDETGWAFATASVSHVLERWLRLIGDDAWFRDLLDLLKSPFVFADMADTRARAAHQLDEAYRRHGAPSGFAGHIELARREGLDDALSLLMRLRQAGARFTTRRATLRDWTRRLLDTVAELGAEAALAADPAGAQMLALLRELARDCAPHPALYGLADWRRWLFQHLEQATFVDHGVASPIRLTHLAAAHTRDLDGAIVLGAGAAQLPGEPAAGIFNDAARAQLGLPTARERERRARDAFADLLARAPRVALIWQCEQDGEAAPLSPWLARLDAFHRAAWGDGLARRVEPAREATLAHAAPTLPAPRADAAPARLTVSAWQSLVACPYQYWARHVLRLNERDEVPEEMDKADYGSLVHRVLAEFHRAHPELAAHDEARLAAALRALGERVFAETASRGYLVSAWQRRWERHADAYLAWALARERGGYRFVSAETPLSRELHWAAHGTTRLEGRADRIDGKGEAVALLDYKTQARTTLKAKLDAAAEDAQLTTYAWLAEADEAGFVTLDADKVENLDWPGDLRAAAAAEEQRLRAVLAGIDAGAPLPAWGAPAVCRWCEMDGLCRRQHRDDAA